MVMSRRFARVLYEVGPGGVHDIFWPERNDDYCSGYLEVPRTVSMISHDQLYGSCSLVSLYPVSLERCK